MWMSPWYEAPKYSDPGECVFVVYDQSDDPENPDPFAEVLKYHEEGSLFWVNEGVGFSWFATMDMDVKSPGIYVFENVRGEYISGDGYSTDDDEEWEADIRPATIEEIADAFGCDFWTTDDMVHVVDEPNAVVTCGEVPVFEEWWNVNHEDKT